MATRPEHQISTSDYRDGITFLVVVAAAAIPMAFAFAAWGPVAPSTVFAATGAILVLVGILLYQLLTCRRVTPSDGPRSSWVFHGALWIGALAVAVGIGLILGHLRATPFVAILIGASIGMVIPRAIRSLYVQRTNHDRPEAME